MRLYSFYAFLLIGRSSVYKMSPDNVASSITPGNFTVGRLYLAKKSDMTDSSPTPIFAAVSDEIGSKSISH